MVILEQQDSGVDVQSRGIVKIQFIARGFHSRTCGEWRDQALQLLNVGVEEWRRKSGDCCELWRGILLLLGNVLGGEGSLRWEGRRHDRTKIVVRGHRRNRLLLLLLLLELHRSHAPNCFLPLNTFLFAGLEHLFVFNSQLAALNVESIQGRHHRIGIARSPEICESKATELARLVEVIIERIWSWDRQ